MSRPASSCRDLAQLSSLLLAYSKRGVGAVGEGVGRIVGQSTGNEGGAESFVEFGRELTHLVERDIGHDLLA